MLEGKRIVLGVTGGIAAYKACELTRLFKKAGAEVRVVMTENAAKFVSPLTFETLSGNQVNTDSFERAWEIGHIALAKWAELMVIAPATANVMAKISAGVCDDLLTTTVMAMPCPVLIAPAMNCVMWRSAANQANVETLRRRGFFFSGPETGSLACGDADVGRMAEPAEIAACAEDLLNPKRDFEGLTVLVTAGPTREMIDPVRFLSNRSTGRMGYAIAEAAERRGAKVVLVSGPVELPVPAGVQLVPVVSTQDMFKAVTENAKTADVVIQAAAPADFTPESVSSQKIKKTGADMAVRLVPTPDIAKTLGENKRPGQILVAFAAETEHVIENARGKLVRKNADLIVANDVSRTDAGFGTDTNVITLITADDVRELAIMPKSDAAHAILDRVQELRA